MGQPFARGPMASFSPSPFGVNALGIPIQLSPVLHALAIIDEVSLMTQSSFIQRLMTFLAECLKTPDIL